MRCPHAEIEQVPGGYIWGTGRAEGREHRQAQEEQESAVEPEKECMRQGKPGERPRRKQWSTVLIN